MSLSNPVPGDFTTDRRVWLLSSVAIVIGLIACCLARLLLQMIAFGTNFFYYGRLSVQPVSPADNHLGFAAVLVPVVGALLIGVMARYGSDKIRGHGIPEALEAIMIGGSRVDVRVAVLKPISAAISIGSGGPFGAEGPIIMTGGAFGSLIAQWLHLTSSERKTLLVCGAAAGMAAVFNTPVAAVLLGVELMLFEWKPRSFVPVALAAGTAAAVRPLMLGSGALFPVTPHLFRPDLPSVLGCLLVGLTSGLLANGLSQLVFGSEALFERLPIHWMWRPALGAVVVGVGGLIYPPALGVGYDLIGKELAGSLPVLSMVAILVVKSIIWAVALGSGTSGGVLAPVLMISGALGGLEGLLLPDQGPGFWALIGLSAGLAGTIGCPLTGVIFALEITHDVNSLLPLLLAASIAHCFTALTSRRSILTEKIAHRGYPLSREYCVDPMSILSVGDVMDTLNDGCPVDLAVRARPEETVLAALYRMAETGRNRLPVVTSEGLTVGSLSLDNALKGRTRVLEQEGRRERFFTLRGGKARASQVTTASSTQTSSRTPP